MTWAHSNIKYKLVSSNLPSFLYGVDFSPAQLYGLMLMTKFKYNLKSITPFIFYTIVVKHQMNNTQIK